MLKLAIITLILIGTVAAVSISGYKGSSKKFVLRHVAADSGKAPIGATMPMSRSASRRVINTESQKLRADRFPEELNYVMTVEGLRDVQLHLVRDRSVRVPRSYSRGKYGQYETHALNTDILAFYKETNGHGSFACQLTKTANGESECTISALLDIGGKNCYLAAGADSLDCSSKEDGKPMFFSEPKIDPAVIPVNRTTSRQKRNTKLPPAAGFRSIEVAYLPDAKFTDLFYRQHPGNTTAAEAEMDLFFTLLTNEINVFINTIEEATSYQLSLQAYAATVAYPGYRMNFPWSEKNNDGERLFYSSALKNNLEFIINDSGFIKEQFDFVFAITGFNLRDGANGNELVSYTFQSVMCTESRRKYSLSEYTAFNLPRILVHELGHALGASHDDDTSCEANVNIMSMNLFNPNTTTKDTYYKFSSCSGAAVIDHVYKQIPDCLVDDAFSYDNDFVPQFCAGYAGTQADYLNKQCERLTNIIGSTACDTVDETACYSRNRIRCTDESGRCTNDTLQYVWNGTPCGTNKFCFKGSCVAKFTVCSTTSSTTTSTSTTTTTAPTTTQTTTSSTTTSPSTTSSTTTSSTTSSTTTSSTTTPTTTANTAQTTTESIIPCSCCGFKRGKRRVRCCRRGFSVTGTKCYCCGNNRKTKPPPGWTGSVF